MADADHLELLRAAAEDFVRRGEGVRHCRAWRDRAPGFDRDAWAQFATLGWLGILIPEDLGGSGLGYAECAVVARALATALRPEPFVEASVAARLVAGSPNRELAARLCPAFAAGRLLPALAWQATGGGFVGGRGVQAEPATGGGHYLSGSARFVAPAAADGFIVAASGPDGLRLAWVAAGAAGLAVTDERRADGARLGRLTLERVLVPHGDCLAVGEAAAGLLDRALDEALVMGGVVLDAVMRRALEMTVEYVKGRVQFGRPVGSFQALQHRAADLLVQHKLAEALLAEAVRALDAADSDARRPLAARVKSRLSDAALRTCAEAVQFHGGMGMADESDIGLYLHRALALSAWLGNGVEHRRRFASVAPPEPVEAFRPDPAWEARARAIGAQAGTDWNAMPDDEFRLLFRTFFELYYPQPLRNLPRRAHWHEFADWYRFQSQRGVIAPNWPREHGGMGLDPAKMVIFVEEQERFQLVRGGLEIGITMVGPLLIRFGTDAQRREHLPRILAGDEVWCQGYSEPGAGSDLAGLATTAVLDGDHFVLDGQKTWTSMAQDATHVVALVRTDRTAKKQEGISFLLVDFATPGITRKPFSTIAGEEEFCNVFFDGARVPRGNLVGGLNQGWSIAKSLLGFERVWIGSTKRSMSALRRLEALARLRGLFEDGDFVARFTRLRLDVLDLGTCYARYIADVRDGRPIGADVSVLKIWATETFQRISELTIEAAGDCGGLWRDFELAGERHDVLSPFFEGRGATIGGGSSEIQRNILARQVLGLPG